MNKIDLQKKAHFYWCPSVNNNKRYQIHTYPGKENGLDGVEAPKLVLESLFSILSITYNGIYHDIMTIILRKYKR